MARLSMAQKAALGAERAKHYWELRGIMERNGCSVNAQLAEILDITEESVRRTLRGGLHSPKVLGWLRAKGAPEYMLCDPAYHMGKLAKAS